MIKVIIVEDEASFYSMLEANAVNLASKVGVKIDVQRIGGKSLHPEAEVQHSNLPLKDQIEDGVRAAQSAKMHVLVIIDLRIVKGGFLRDYVNTNIMERSGNALWETVPVIIYTAHEVSEINRRESDVPRHVISKISEGAKTAKSLVIAALEECLIYLREQGANS